ncbi:MAG: hypothetical protein QN720_06870 [Nitrososphaeraceae archaeon]|nr:hypothetical protein [Nitrososphaeraceae archaeon]MDW0332677.1 hypothetical protein [Nitrososphaeraceae archaeon]
MLLIIKSRRGITRYGPVNRSLSLVVGHRSKYSCQREEDKEQQLDDDDDNKDES